MAAQRANLHLVVNNVRFLVLVRHPHLASRVLAANLRRLSRDWQDTYGHPVVLVESFVDSSRFRGTCYRASNWQCVGETQGWAKRGHGYRLGPWARALILISVAVNAFGAVTFGRMWQFYFEEIFPVP